ncbi:Uncharacterised protein [uncultured archaeon]|nr:Uncharacterised protein [uncultured archaeon]
MAPQKPNSEKQMLPKEFDLNNLDEGIRGLIITLNRIPEVNKKTTIYGPTSCQGHVYKDGDGRPHSTKDGWIYFYRPTLKRIDLAERIKQFCNERPYFSLDELNVLEESDFIPLGLDLNQSEELRNYSINASFWIDAGYEDNYRVLRNEKKLIEKASIRQQELLSGWQELDSRIKDYIIKNITKDIESLPYQSWGEATQIIPFCPNHCCY